MESNSGLLEREGVVNPVLSGLNRQPTFLVKEGPAMTSRVDAIAQGANASNAQHNALIPSYDHIVDRSGAIWQASPQFTFPLSISSKDGSDITLPPRPQPLFIAPGAATLPVAAPCDIGFASHVLHRLVSNAAVQMGGSLTTSLDADTLDLLLPMIDPEVGHRPYRSMRGKFMFNDHARGTSYDVLGDAVGSVHGSGHHGCEGNGSFNSQITWIDSTGAPATVSTYTPAAYPPVAAPVAPVGGTIITISTTGNTIVGYVYFDKIADTEQIWPYIVAAWSGGSTPEPIGFGGTASCDLNLRLECRENLLIPPFTQQDVSGPGLWQLQQIQFQFGFRSPTEARVFLKRAQPYSMSGWYAFKGGNINNESAIIRIGDAKWFSSAAWNDSRISLITLQPQPDNLPPQVCTFGTYKIYHNRTQSKEVAFGVEELFSSSTTTVPQIPSFLAIAAPLDAIALTNDASKGVGSTGWDTGFAERANHTIEGVSITFNGTSSIFNNYTKADLYDLTRKCVPNMDYPTFSGRLVKNGIAVPSVGNMIVVRGEDLWLPPGVCPGQPGAIQFQLQARVKSYISAKYSNRSLGCTLFTVLVCPVFYTMSRGSLAEIPSTELANPNEVFRLRSDRANYFTSTDLMVGGSLTGGGLWDTLLGLASKAKGVWDRVRGVYDKGKNLYETGKKVYDTGKAVYNTAMPIINSSFAKPGSRPVGPAEDPQEMVMPAQPSAGAKRRRFA